MSVSKSHKPFGTKDLDQVKYNLIRKRMIAGLVPKNLTANHLLSGFFLGQCFVTWGILATDMKHHGQHALASLTWNLKEVMWIRFSSRFFWYTFKWHRFLDFSTTMAIWGSSFLDKKKAFQIRRSETKGGNEMLVSMLRSPFWKNSKCVGLKEDERMACISILWSPDKLRWVEPLQVSVVQSWYWFDAILFSVSVISWQPASSLIEYGIPRERAAEPNETCRGEDSESQSQFLVEVVLHAAGEPREASAETPIWHRFFCWMSWMVSWSTRLTLAIHLCPAPHPKSSKLSVAIYNSFWHCSMKRCKLLKHSFAATCDA